MLFLELADGVADYLVRCQTYEGGFGGEPSNEAHGGYNFCALAALLILGRGSSCDLDGQRRWLLRMQTQVEGGFRGRTNKLVDACYSYWQGGAFAVLRLIELGLSDCADCAVGVKEDLPELHVVAMNSTALQKYVIHCAQQPEGGLRGMLTSRDGGLVNEYIMSGMYHQIIMSFLSFLAIFLHVQTNLAKVVISITAVTP